MGVKSSVYREVLKEKARFGNAISSNPVEPKRLTCVTSGNLKEEDVQYIPINNQQDITCFEFGSYYVDSDSSSSLDSDEELSKGNLVDKKEK